VELLASPVNEIHLHMLLSSYDHPYNDVRLDVSSRKYHRSYDRKIEIDSTHIISPKVMLSVYSGVLAVVVTSEVGQLRDLDHVTLSSWTTLTDGLFTCSVVPVSRIYYMTRMM